MSVLLGTNKALGLKLEVNDVSQAMLEQWLKETECPVTTPNPIYHGLVLRAAINAGWLVQPADMSADMVAGLAPRVVRWYAQKLVAHYKELITIPPD